MKSKISVKSLRRRLFFSIATGVVFAVTVVVAFKTIQNGERTDGAPRVLRKSFVLNEHVWKILQSARKLSVKKPVPPKGKEPRVNGWLGLESELPKNYEVKIENGERKFSLPIAMFHLLPKVEYSTDFRCIEGWSEETHYGGVRFSDFLTKYDLGKKADGSYYEYVGLETPDREYYVSIDMESMLHPQTVLAYEMNQLPLSLDNGYPIRLIIPIKYGIKSLKRIGKITFSDVRPPDYWALQGYDWYSGL